MTGLTKRALTSTFLELLEDKPLDKITVREIVEECGVSRNTFYYHFHDIYELIEEMLNGEIERIMYEGGDDSNLTWVFRQVCQLSAQHSMALYHLYHSSDHDRVMSYVHQAAKFAVYRVVDRHAEGVGVSEGDIELICNLFASIVEGVTTSMIRGEMGGAEDVDAYVTRICQLMDGVVDLTIVNATRNWDNPVYVGYDGSAQEPHA